MVMDFQHHSHDGLTFEGDAPATRTRYLGDQLVDMEELEEPGNRGTKSSQDGLVSDVAKELVEDVPVAKAHDGVLPAHHGGEEIYVLFGSGIEPSIGSSIAGYGIGQFLKMFLGLGGVVQSREGLQIAAVGCMADLGVTVEVGHSLGHGKPADHRFTLAPTLTPDFELVRMIDDGLDTQYAPMFVVHLYPVFFHPMLDPCPRPSLPVLVEDFTLKGPVEFSTEEGHDIFGTEAKGGMVQ